MNSNKTNEQPWSEWLARADDDFISLESLVKHRDGAPSTGCFLAQQAVEKMFKALLVLHADQLEKIHDLVALAGKVRKHEPEIEQFAQDIAVLTRYYIETRYPGNYPEFDWEECRRAYEIATRIKEFVTRIVIAVEHVE